MGNHSDKEKQQKLKFRKTEPQTVPETQSMEVDLKVDLGCKCCCCASPHIGAVVSDPPDGYLTLCQSHSYCWWCRENEGEKFFSRNQEEKPSFVCMSCIVQWEKDVTSAGFKMEETTFQLVETQIFELS